VAAWRSRGDNIGGAARIKAQASNGNLYHAAAAAAATARKAWHRRHGGISEIAAQQRKHHGGMKSASKAASRQRHLEGDQHRQLRSGIGGAA